MPKETWYDDKDKPFQPGIHYAVGGATKLYGAALYRLRPEDFGELRHHDGISPAWPISYDDMEPYYTKAEHLYEVHGNHGEDSTEGHASAQYPFPALTHEPRIQQLSDDLERAGYHPFHAPCGVRLLEDDRPNSRCIRCQTCDGFPCLVQAKSDAEMLGVRPALEHSNVSLRTRAVVDPPRDRTRPGPPSSGSIVERDDAEETLRRRHRRRLGRGGELGQDPARIGQRPHPNGLANGSGQVGRNYMFHNSVAVLAISKEPNPTMFQKTLGRERLLLRDARASISRWATSRWSASPTREMFKGEKPLQTKLAPMFSLDDVATHAVDFWLSTEDLPTPDNRVTLTSDGKIRLTYTPNNQEPKQRLYHQLKSMLGHLGMHPDHLLPRTGYLKNEIPIAGVRPPGRDRPVRDRPGDLGAGRRTARPTSSTTCTSSTRASSRASAP